MHDSEPTSLDQKLQQSTPLRVHDVTISGNTRTKDYIIERHLQSARAAQTVGELASALEDAQDGLERLNLFASVQVVADSGPKELPDTSNINITVEELKDGRSYSLGTYVQGQEQTMEGSGKLFNSMGHGEEVDAHFSIGRALSNSLECSYRQPHILASDLHLQAGISSGCKSYEHRSSHSQSHLGCSVSLSHTKGHEVGYDLAWRANTVTPRASPTIYKQAGHSVLSAVRYGCTFQQGVFSGTYNVQLAGLGLSRKLPRFLKQEIAVHCTSPLPFSNAAFSCTTSAGLLLHTGTSHINDHFFLGGPRDIRGFRTFGVGPTDTHAPDPESGRVGKDSIGGSAFFSHTTGLSFDLPLLTQYLGVRGHVFGCGGTLGGLDGMGGMGKLRSDPKGALKDTLGSIRASVGAGILFPPSVVGRVELNFTRVLRKLPSDKAVGNKFGVQIGFGVSPP